MFIDTSFLPKSKVTHVVADKNAPTEFIDNLKKLNIEVILSTDEPNLSGTVSTHPDMQIFHLGGNRAVCSKGTYSYYSEKLSPLGFEVMEGEAQIHSNYPFDIAYNVLRVGNLAFSKTAQTDEKITEDLRNKNIRIIDVAQGYTKCAVCVVGENAVITADAGLYKIFSENGVDTLKISEGEIELSGMEYGFIGGCSGLIAPDLLVFCGNVEKHPDYRKIKAFAKKHGVNILSVASGKLLDIGSLIPVREVMR